MIRLRSSGVSEMLIKRIPDWFDPGPGAFITNPTSAFSPLSLFAADEQGAWYDPSDLTTLFQDAAGTTPVTAVEQPVGLMLDKSKGLVLGSELIANGNFSSGGTSWNLGNWTATTGSVSISNNAGSIYQTVAVSGEYYEITFTVTSISAGRIRAQSGFNYGSYVTSPGTYTQRVLASQVYAGVVADTGTTATINFISCKKVTGNHAYQTTSASRPVLSARVNLLTKTEQFDDAVWASTSVAITANAAVAPNGTNTADLVIPTTTNVEHYLDVGIGAAISAVSGVSYRLAVSAKAGGYRWLRIAFNGSITPTSNRAAWFDLQNGVVGTVQSGVTATITAQANGNYLCSIERSATASSTPPQFGFFQICNADNTTAFAGNGTSGIYLWGADLRVANDGVGIPAYQRVNTSTDYDTTGFPLYLKTDGVDDFMVTNSINFTGTDKMTVWAGLRYLSASFGIVLEEGNGVVTPTFSIWSTSTQAFYYASQGTGSSQGASISVTYPATVVGVGESSISTPLVRAKINGGSYVSNTTTQGSGNYGNTPLYLFRRGGTTLPFNGRCYSLIVRGAQSTDAQITSTETWVDGKTKAY